MKMFNVRFQHSAVPAQIVCQNTSVRTMADIFELAPQVIAFNIAGIKGLEHHSKFKEDLYPEQVEQKYTDVLNLCKLWPYETTGIKIGRPIWRKLWDYYSTLGYYSDNKNCINIACKDSYMVKIRMDRTIDLLSAQEVFIVGQYQFQHATAFTAPIITRRIV